MSGVNARNDERSSSPDVGVGGGGSISTGLSSNVVGAIVMSSSIAAALTTGVAGRAICCGGGGISISGGMSIASVSTTTIDMSSAFSSGKNAKIPKWIAVAAMTEPQNQLLKLRLNRSFAVSSTREARGSSSVVVVMRLPPCAPHALLEVGVERHAHRPRLLELLLDRIDVAVRHLAVRTEHHHQLVVSRHVLWRHHVRNPVHRDRLVVDVDRAVPLQVDVHDVLARRVQLLRRLRIGKVQLARLLLRERRADHEED